MTIKEQFNLEDFNMTYKGTRAFCETAYFAKFIELLEDEDTLEKIRFVNDVLHIPPVQCFVELYRDFFTEQIKKDIESGIVEAGKGLPAMIKQGIGACFGYLYQKIYRNYYGIIYEAEPTWFGDIVTAKEPWKTGIKKASYFIKE